MGRIIWCCFPVAIFTVGWVYVLIRGIRDLQYIGFLFMFPLSCASGFLLIWIARLASAVVDYRKLS